jgi:hypothetical protein
MPSTTTDFSAFGIVLFGAGATFFARLLACFFVSHNCYPFFVVLFSRPHITRRGSDPFFMSIQVRRGKRHVGAGQ